MKRSGTFPFLILIISFLSLFSSVQAQREIPQLSEQAEISLMTCGPGTELYSMFGHSALWVLDPVNQIDRVYNYGTFDFDDENFYYKFVRGIADYKLSITSSRGFMQEYIGENRTVLMQLLELSAVEKQKLFEAVEENYKPENRYYRYDFLFLNCSSILRDRVFTNLDRPYKLDSTEYKQTFRDLLQPYINTTWITLGINFLLGHQADREATNWERMFLPDHLHDQFELAIINNQDCLAPVSKTLYLSTAPPPAFNQKFLDTPLLFAFILFIVIGMVTRKQLYQKKWNNWLDVILFTLSGVAGLLLLFMWFFSEHEVTHQNINLLWSFPLHLFLAILLWFPRLRKFIKVYAQIALGLAALFLLMAVMGIQQVPWTLILFSGVLMLRLFRLAFMANMPNQIN